ncbi:MAG: signal peptide peptidase SppA, partial [Dehalococcoidia bacterium]
MSIPFLQRGRIGVVEVFGVIGGTVRVPQYDHLLRRLGRSRRIKAVVVDIDSPGGSASASEYLYTSLARITAIKPVVAFIRGSGTSGAYYLACAASRVVALPSSLVGSIGVISLRPVIQELLQRLGIGITVHKSGPFKDMGAFWRSPTPEEEAKLQALVDEFYQSFVQVVARARGMEEERVREYATGELFTGRRAQELGLVDELGDLERAIDLAAELGKAPRRPMWVRPPRTFFERLGRRFAQEMTESLAQQVERSLLQGVFYLPPRLP